MSYPANLGGTPKDVAFLLYEGVEILDLAGPAEVFAETARLTDAPGYGIDYYCANPSGRARSSAGLELLATPINQPITADTLVLPGAGLDDLQKAIADQRVMDWLQHSLERSNRIASVCTGAFLLGELGLLDGRRATTHWASLDELARRHPDALVEDATLWLRDGHVWTSAGILSGVALALAMVRADYGATVALEIARRLVVYLVRDGGQSQFSAPLDLHGRAGRSDLSKLIGWLQANLDQTVRVEDMADYMHSSVRSLHRRCRDVFDRTPSQLLTELRLEQARALLQGPSVPLGMVADQCGYGSASALTKAFTQRYGVSPKRFRERFRHPDA